MDVARNSSGHGALGGFEILASLRGLVLFVSPPRKQLLSTRLFFRLEIYKKPWRASTCCEHGIVEVVHSCPQSALLGVKSL